MAGSLYLPFCFSDSEDQKFSFPFDGINYIGTRCPSQSRRNHERRIDSRYSRSFVLFSFNHFVERKPLHRARLVSGRSICTYRDHRYKNHRHVDKPTSVFYVSMIGVPVYVCACVLRVRLCHIYCARASVYRVLRQYCIFGISASR